jgi:hypothetical protein
MQVLAPEAWWFRSLPHRFRLRRRSPPLISRDMLPPVTSRVNEPERA